MTSETSTPSDCNGTMPIQPGSADAALSTFAAGAPSVSMNVVA